MRTRHHADRLIDVSILPDYHDDTIANSVWVNFVENGVPRKTNAPTLTLDGETRKRVIRLLQSAIDYIGGL